VGAGVVTVRVAVTVGLGVTPLALKVMTQEWFPGVALAVLTDADKVLGVVPAVGSTVSQAQSEPKVEVNPTPKAGLLLVTPMLCRGGSVPPTI